MDYESKRPQFEGLLGEYIADLEQTCGISSLPGPVVPSQVTHGTIHSFNQKRHMLSNEFLCAQGFPCIPEACKCKYTLPWQSLIDNCELSSCELKFIAGNAMHLAILHAWTLYWLSSIRKYDECSLMFSAHHLLNSSLDVDSDLMESTEQSTVETEKQEFTTSEKQESINSLAGRDQQIARAGA